MNMKKTALALMTALVCTGAYAGSNYYHPDAYWVPAKKVKWGKAASEEVGEKVLKNAAKKSHVHYKYLNHYNVAADANNVKTIHAYNQKRGNYMGNFAFSTIKSGGSEVYYGEWNGTEYVKGKNRAVYYSGDKRAVNMPMAGNATYNVQGINHYNGNNAMTGQLHADFGKRTLTGSMQNAAVKMDVYSNINPYKASFKGHAVANGHFGKTEGHFFGDGATSLAGVAKFKTNRALDTAFGGTKQ
ncbi:Slam-dependent surface lipoprotein [Neisseria weaveri]|uniref:Uncharacterized protein n=1 Tax=Neisseria weaveri TaxID=28091 RepID=A0A448VN05_9NEIS|nr:Slam-dependent surface lipoprotein [Neisseria weaveri]EGV36832.1 hypothetical protein l11_15820 [Neisseria weaveri LMG 5135]EGV37315.1 hypothetical protein l13_04270 [Neisseria weaveri ATCC 51223]SAY51765.1 Uncharacterised protein [Neisseria weaveri]VEJ51160.1 Uncharacterised protein [Neisseria weaveri]